MKAPGFVLAVFAAGLLLSYGSTLGWAHGDVTPQPVDTEGLKPLGEAWLEENPYRENAKAIEIGAKAYNQNCASCHGVRMISGGLAPDLRYLEKGKSGDEWFMERMRNGAKINGVMKMPKYEGLMNQEAMWAIRAYVEANHEES